MALTLSPQVTRSIVAHQKSGESPIGVDLVEEPDRTVRKKIFVHTGWGIVHSCVLFSLDLWEPVSFRDN